MSVHASKALTLSPSTCTGAPKTPAIEDTNATVRGRVVVSPRSCGGKHARTYITVRGVYVRGDWLVTNGSQAGCRMGKCRCNGCAKCSEVCLWQKRHGNNRRTQARTPCHALNYLRLCVPAKHLLTAPDHRHRRYQHHGQGARSRVPMAAWRKTRAYIHNSWRCVRKEGVAGN